PSHGDGIGSRFFNIQNGATGASADPGNPSERAIHLRKARLQRPVPPVDGSPAFRKGYDLQESLTPIRQAGEGLFEPVELRELDRLELHLPSGQQWTAALRVGDELRDLPIGSTFDPEGGIFYWQLGPAFLGEFALEFRAADGTLLPISVRGLQRPPIDWLRPVNPAKRLAEGIGPERCASHTVPVACHFHR
ncbi:MAG: hypothetical protein IPP47_21215, partial [Bryobacterales bacterium]|nr:hypothetical protein [Bryobacterales bacterium]